MAESDHSTSLTSIDPYDTFIPETTAMHRHRKKKMSKPIILDQNTPSVQYLCKKDKRLAKLIQMAGPITYTTHADRPFTFLVHEIIEQMLSVKAAKTISGRLEILCDGQITPESILRLTDEQIRSAGTSNAKAQYIRNLANALTEGTLCFEELTGLPDEEVIRRLTKLRGIGTWTAKMYLLFVLDRPDVLPVEDVAFLQVYRWLYKTEDCSGASVKAKCRKWKPYSSIAARYFYHALDEGLTKEPFHLFK